LKHLNRKLDFIPIANVALKNIGNKPHVLAPTIPSNVFMIYQCMFAAITPCLAFGSAAERTTVLYIIHI